eukprot:gene3830-4181_t
MSHSFILFTILSLFFYLFCFTTTTLAFNLPQRRCYGIDGTALLARRKPVRSTAGKEIAARRNKQTSFIEDEILADIESLRNNNNNQSPLSLSSSSTIEDNNNNNDKTTAATAWLTPLKNALSLILVVDFFVIIGFLIWFLVGIGLQSSYPVVLQVFQSIFQSVVVPALTVLMAGSIISGLMSKKDDEDDDSSKKSRRQ